MIHGGESEVIPAFFFSNIPGVDKVPGFLRKVVGELWRFLIHNGLELCKHIVVRVWILSAGHLDQ